MNQRNENPATAALKNIFHHELIWYRQDLPQQHEQILEAISWIEPAVKIW